MGNVCDCDTVNPKAELDRLVLSRIIQDRTRIIEAKEALLHSRITELESQQLRMQSFRAPSQVISERQSEEDEEDDKKEIEISRIQQNEEENQQIVPMKQRRTTSKNSRVATREGGKKLCDFQFIVNYQMG